MFLVANFLKVNLHLKSIYGQDNSEIQSCQTSSCIISKWHAAFQHQIRDISTFERRLASLPESQRMFLLGAIGRQRTRTETPLERVTENRGRGGKETFTFFHYSHAWTTTSSTNKLMMACAINLLCNQPGFNRMPLSEDCATWDTFFPPTYTTDCRSQHGRGTRVHSGHRHCKKRRAQPDGIRRKMAFYSWRTNGDAS